VTLLFAIDSMARSTRVTTVFTKQPEAGLVKTRLVPLLGATRAAELALAMLDDTVQKCVGESSFETVLCVAPDTAIAWFEARYPEIARVVPQIGSQLGERMAQRFDDEFACGDRTIVALGSDAPHTPIEWTIEVHERLERGADVVLGLDDGGGYHTIGLKRSVPQLFRDVPMSTADMGERTVNLARSMGLVVEFIPSSFDIDVPPDLKRLRDLLTSDPEVGARLPRTNQALRSLPEL